MPSNAWSRLGQSVALVTVIMGFEVSLNNFFYKACYTHKQCVNEAAEYIQQQNCVVLLNQQQKIKWFLLPH